MSCNRFIVSIFCILLYSNSLLAQEARAYVDRTEISMDESLILTVSIANGYGKVDSSVIKDFKVIPRGQTQNTTIINGRTTSEVGIRFALIPKKEGKLTIPSLTVEVNGGKIHTEPIYILVSKEGKKNEDSDNDVFVTSQVSDDTVYIGQEFIYTFRLYNAVEVTDLQFANPAFKGFTFKKIDQNPSYQKVINGRQYTVRELSYLLKAKESGKIEIEGAELNYSLVQKRGPSIDPFGGFFNDPFFSQNEIIPRLITSNAIEMTIFTLPENKSNTRFMGLIGKFDVEVAMEKLNVTVGDSVTLSIIVKGTGNIEDAELPELAFPSEFKIYSDIPEENVAVTSDGTSGKKIFRKALVPLTEGNYEIPEVRINFFDPEKEIYVIKETKPYLVKVMPSSQEKSIAAQMTSDNMSKEQSSKKKVTVTGRDILPLKEDVEAIRSEHGISLTYFILFLMIPPSLFVCFQTMIHFLRKPASFSLQMSERSSKMLKLAENDSLSQEIFVSSLYKAFISTILSKADIKGENLTFAEAKAFLEAAGFPSIIQESAVSLLASIESANYSGKMLSADDRKQLLNRTQSLVRSISK